MASYTVKTGDNLWNILKREFKLTSNAEIAKKVKEIKDDNNLSNPDLIFPGQVLDFGAVDTIEISANDAAKQRINNSNIETYDDVNNLENSSVSLWGQKSLDESEKKQAYTKYSETLLNDYYDLNKDGTVTVEEFAQKEKESSLEAQRLSSLHMLDVTIAETQKNPDLLAYFDEDKNGQLSKEEYFKGEANMFTDVNYDIDGDGTITEDEYFKATKQSDYWETSATRLTNLFAQNLDFNANGQIDASELAFFNETADSLDGNIDGVITNEKESAMVVGVSGMNADNPEYNRVVNKYLQGETLTAEEEQILKDCQATIRKNLSKSAGLVSND